MLEKEPFAEMEEDQDRSGPEDFDLEAALFGGKREDLGIEDIFAEKELTEEKPKQRQFTDVHEIMKPAERERRDEDRAAKIPDTVPAIRKPPPEWKKEPEIPEGEIEIPDIRELIKGTRQKKEGEEEKNEKRKKPQEDFDPRDIVKGKD